MYFYFIYFIELFSIFYPHFDVSLYLVFISRSYYVTITYLITCIGPGIKFKTNPIVCYFEAQV